MTLNLTIFQLNKPNKMLVYNINKWLKNATIKNGLLLGY